jgi:hypothetical protein
MPEPVRILYIASMGHSGSTLLDYLLSAHSRVFSVGEIIFLSDYAHVRREKDQVHRFGSECTCGAETVWACPFWTEVDRVLTARSGMTLRDLELRQAEPAAFREHNTALFEAVAEVAGTRVIVDSSKAPRRLRMLLRHTDLDVRPIHLVRHPRASVHSHLRKNPEQPWATARMAARFVATTLYLRAVLAGRPRARVRYERLVRDPEGYTRRLTEFAGLEYEPEQLTWAGREHHNIGGNQMRRTTDSTIRVSEGWREAIRGPRAWAIDAATLPALAGFGG